MKKSSTRTKSRKSAAPTGKNAMVLPGVRAAKDAIKRLKARLKNARKLAKRFKKQLKAAKLTLKAASKTARRLAKKAPKASPAPGGRRAGNVPTGKKAAIRHKRRASKPSAQRTSALKNVGRPIPPATVKKPVTPAAVPPKRKTRPRRPANTALSKAPETTHAPAAESRVETAPALSNPEAVEPAAEPSSPT